MSSVLKTGARTFLGHVNTDWARLRGGGERGERTVSCLQVQIFSGISRRDVMASEPITNANTDSDDLHGMVPDKHDTALLLIDVINDLDFEGNEGSTRMKMNVVL